MFQITNQMAYVQRINVNLPECVSTSGGKVLECPRTSRGGGSKTSGALASFLGPQYIKGPQKMWDAIPSGTQTREWEIHYLQIYLCDFPKLIHHRFQGIFQPAMFDDTRGYQNPVGKIIVMNLNGNMPINRDMITPSQTQANPPTAEPAVDNAMSWDALYNMWSYRRLLVCFEFKGC